MSQKTKTTDNDGSLELIIRVFAGVVLVAAGVVFIGRYDSILTTIVVYGVLFTLGVLGGPGIVNGALGSGSDTNPDAEPESSSTSSDQPGSPELGSPESFTPNNTQAPISTQNDDPAIVADGDVLDSVDLASIRESIQEDNSKTFTPAEAAAIIPNLTHEDWEQRSSAAAALGWAIRSHSKAPIKETYTGNWDLWVEVAGELYNIIVYQNDQLMPLELNASFALFQLVSDTESSASVINTFVDRDDRNREDGLKQIAESDEIVDVTTANVIAIVALSMAHNPSHRDTPNPAWFDQFESHDDEGVRKAARWGKNRVHSQHE